MAALEKGVPVYKEPPKLRKIEGGKGGGFLSRHRTLAGLVLVTGLAVGGMFGANAAINSGQGPKPSGETPSPTDTFKPTPSGEPTATVVPSPEVTPKVIRLDEFASRPVKQVSDKELETALAKVTSFNLMTHAKNTVDLCENGDPRRETIGGKIFSRYEACEAIAESLLETGYYKNDDPNALPAARVAYDYTVWLLHKANAEGVDAPARVDLDLALMRDLDAAKVPYFYR